MVIGSILAKCQTVKLSTADEKHYTLKNNLITRLALRLIGVPHLGFRIRARIILREAMKAPRSARILDAGCGYGLYSLTLAELGYKHIDALELEAERITALHTALEELPAAKAHIKVQQDSLTHLPFDDNSYDVIICSDVIEHIADDISAVRELSRVLKPEGLLILSVPYNSKYQRRIFKMFGHERPGYTKEELATLFARFGLKIDRDFYYEYPFGNRLFTFFNHLTSKPLMGILFYPFYLLYLLDSSIARGEPSGIVVTAKKN